MQRGRGCSAENETDFVQMCQHAGREYVAVVGA